MGNGQASFVQACRGPSDDTLKESQGRAPTAEELDSYVAEIKSTVLEQVESVTDRYHRYWKSFEPDTEGLRKACAAFVDEVNVGLRNHPIIGRGGQGEPCSLKMLDSFVPHNPTGKESGIFYAVDFGGSNLRVLRLDMKDGKITSSASRASLSDANTPELARGLMDSRATATQMFDFFASVAKQFMEENGDLSSGKTFPAGFTFSYPCTFRSLDSAELMVWTKGLETGRDTTDQVEGGDVGQLMNTAFQRNGVPLYIACVANDTVGTLLSAAYTLPRNLPPVTIGLILGTGVNACYTEKRAGEHGYKGSIVNMESGAFNRMLPATNIDHEVDFADAGGRGRQHYEKMVSGAYLGEICRRTFVKILQYKASPKMHVPYIFTSEDASTVIGDRSEQLIVTARKCKERFEADLSLEELTWVQNICEIVFRRSAALAAMKIAAVSQKTGRLQQALGGLTCAIDGSLWKCNKFYKDNIRHYLNEILGTKQSALIHLIDADDGSGLGAGILAAVAASE